METKDELVHLSFMKVVAMILVMFIHSTYFLDKPSMFWKDYHPEAPWDIMVYVDGIFGILLVPSFIFVSGFLFARSQEIHHYSVFEQIAHRAKRLLVLWFFTMLFWLIPIVLIFDISMYGRPEGGGIWETYKAGLFGKCSFHLWYLLCLFWATLYLALSIGLIRRYRYWGLLGFAVAFAGMCLINAYCKNVLYWCFWKSGQYIFLMYLGIFTYKHRKKIDAFFYNHRILSIILFAGCFSFTLLTRVVPWEYMAFVSSVFVFLFYGLSLNIVKTWNTFFTSDKTFSFLNENVMLYYLFHAPLNFVIFYLLVDKMHLNKYAFFITEFVVLFIVTTILVKTFLFVKGNSLLTRREKTPRNSVLKNILHKLQMTSKNILIIMCLFSVSLLPSQQPAGKEIILEKVKATDSYLRATRAYLHEYPELSGKEFETARFIRSEIAKSGLAVTQVPGTGFYAVLDTHRPGKTIGLRADIDALPIAENPQNLKQAKKWISKNEGVSHACGHDGHMAILLGAAKILIELQAHLNGKIVFIFEEGEETNCGINAMIEALRPLKINAIYGNHLKSSLNTGEIYIQEGTIMAGTGTIAFDVIGKGGHASRPDLSINPVFATANVLTGISIAWNNQRDITKTLTLGISQIHGGEIYNVIPNSVYIGGTIRFFDLSEGRKGFSILKKVSEDIAQAHRCSVRFHDKMGIAMGPVVNNTSLARFAREAVKELYPDKVVSGEQYIWYAAETFARYSELAPALFTFVGVKNDNLGSGAEHHNDRFDIDEEALSYAVGAMVQVAVRF
ncbi:MAG: amidohydrolase [Dysgonamonadaceae bacterium]|nr:amidohydrolase [Dysgonamonadaceae bacterium]